jgi:hypothetical protein
MGGPFSTNGGEELTRIGYIGGKETTRKTKTLMGWGDVDWIGLAQDRNRWRALVNSVLNLRVP